MISHVLHNIFINCMFLYLLNWIPNISARQVLIRYSFFPKNVIAIDIVYVYSQGKLLNFISNVCYYDLLIHSIPGTEG